jgi:NADH-quinone oxidoreductase subunit A
MILVPKLIAPNKPQKVKSEIYECGEKPFHGAWFNYNPRFYMIAVIFIIFDVEVALTFPIATVYKSWLKKGVGSLALVEILVFVLILAFAFLRLWKKGDFEWNRQVEGFEPDKNKNVKSLIKEHVE